jgi:hypothetical protein
VAAAALWGLVADQGAKPDWSGLARRGLQQGQTVELEIQGKHLAAATEVKSSHAGLTARLVGEPQAERATIAVAAAADLPAGKHELWLAGPGGESGRQAVWVDELPQVVEVEPNDRLDQASLVTLPAGAWGVLAAKGDIDHFRFEGRAGQQLVLDLAGERLGAKLNAQLTLFDNQGRVVGGNNDFDGQADPLLAYTLPADGNYVLQVRDQTLAGGHEHFYRVSLGALPLVAAVYPLSVAPESDVEVALLGYNLPAGLKVKLRSPASGEAEVPVEGTAYRTRRPLRVLVGTGPEVLEQEPNDAPAEANLLGVPGTAGGRVQGSGGRREDADLYRFEARGGEAVVLEIEAARRGSPLDSVIEVLHADGRPVERAWLQAVRDSAITFRGIDANSRDVRLVNWEEMQLNEYVYLNGEVCRLFRAPQGPDSGFLLYEGEGGKRRCYFDTSATTHPLDQPCYIVVPRPVGAALPANGLPVFRLPYANDDDGQRRLGSDSRLIFDAPADGTYLVRVRDARGFEGERFSYRLTVRPARPDFQVSLGGVNPTVGAGSGKTFDVVVQRIDGFEGEVRVDIGGRLPQGFAVTTPLVVEAGHREAKGVVTAAADAPPPTEADWSHTEVTATAMVAGQVLTRPAPSLGRIGLAPRPKLVVRLVPEEGSAEIVMAPGSRTPCWLKVERSGYDGLVNLEGLNLPHGVIIDNIGLNAVQILEGQSERRVFLYCAPWVKETERPVHAVGRAEGDQASPPVRLVVRPAGTH